LSVLTKLANIANRLDLLGLYSEASVVDGIIKNAKDPRVEAWQRGYNQAISGTNLAPLDVDGAWGPKTQAASKSVQDAGGTFKQLANKVKGTAGVAVKAPVPPQQSNLARGTSCKKVWNIIHRYNVTVRETDMWQPILPSDACKGGRTRPTRQNIKDAKDILNKVRAAGGWAKLRSTCDAIREKKRKELGANGLGEKEMQARKTQQRDIFYLVRSIAIRKFLKGISHGEAIRKLQAAHKQIVEIAKAVDSEVSQKQFLSANQKREFIYNKASQKIMEISNAFA